MAKTFSVLSLLLGVALVVTVAIHIHYAAAEMTPQLIVMFPYGLLVGGVVWCVSLVCLAFGCKTKK